MKYICKIEVRTIFQQLEPLKGNLARIELDENQKTLGTRISTSTTSQFGVTLRI